MQVIIAEKPSVAKNIAEALKIRNRKDGYFKGKKHLITWAFGHLLELYDSKDYDEKMAKWEMNNFPFIPKKFKYKIKSNSKDKKRIDKGAKKQLNIIKKLVNKKDVTEVVSACDFDREGQIIGDIILNYLGVKKPVKRLLLNEWTPNEVLNGLNNLKPNEDLKFISDAGICRQWADWTIGINLTSVTTLKYKKTMGVLNIGRVLLPTLKIIYDRDKEIDNFVSKDFFRLNGTFINSKKEVYKGVYYRKNKNRFDNKKGLQDFSNKIRNKKAVVVKKETKRKKEYPPFLFNLSGLQGYVTNKYSNWTSDKVLKVAQSLYEKKFITYPRTASIALEESLISKTKKVLNILKKGLPYEKEISFIKTTRVFNNKKVEGHSAIIPTYLKPNKLTKDEKIIYKEIKDRFIMQFMPVSEFDEIIIETKVDNNGVFITKGRTLQVKGWKKVQNIKTKEIFLPDISLNEAVKIKDLKISSHKTRPPSYHNEKTLLRVMEVCGKKYSKNKENTSVIMDAVLSGFSIGTPATRGSTIEKLKTVGYIKSKNKFLTCSALGKSLVENYPIKELFDLEYTGRLEKTLLDIEKGKVFKKDFLSFIFDFTKQAVEKIKKDNGGFVVNEKKHKQEEVLGSCPECGEAVIENSKAYGCSDWKNGCKFAVWKNDKFLASMQKKPTKKMVKTLLKDGEVEVFELISKKGNKFDAILSYSKKETGYYSWNMKFLNKKNES